MAIDMGARRREILTELRSELIAAAVHAKSGTPLIGLGEAIDALDLLLEGGQVDVRVEVSIGFRFGGEGMYAHVEIDEDGVRLSTMSSGPVTVNYSLDWWDFSTWRDTLHEILNLDGTLTVSRNHL